MGDKLNPSEAVYGFAAWLTTRDTVTTMSTHHDSGTVAELVIEFCKSQGLPPITPNWPENLRRTEEAAKEPRIPSFAEAEWTAEPSAPAPTADMPHERDKEQAAMKDYMANLRERLRGKALAEQGANLAKEDKGYYNCPSCGYELDTGWECGRCGADWQEEATRKPIPKDLWSKLHGTPPSDDGYDSLRAVFTMALEQAQGGKGKERHANGQPFDQQPICQGGRRFGPGCLIYQAWKKAHETPVLLGMDNGKERAVRELLGVINYAAAAIIVLQEDKS